MKVVLALRGKLLAEEGKNFRKRRAHYYFFFFIVSKTPRWFH